MTITDGVMPKAAKSGKPTTRRYTDAERAQAVRLVRQLRAELGADHGIVNRVANQLGYGLESVRSWVRRADIDEGVTAGTTTADAVKIKALGKRSRSFAGSNQDVELSGVEPLDGGALEVRLPLFLL